MSCMSLFSCIGRSLRSVLFFFNDTATTEIYTLSLHDALPISARRRQRGVPREIQGRLFAGLRPRRAFANRSEEHTSELLSQSNLVCRLLLEKKKKQWAGAAAIQHDDSYVDPRARDNTLASLSL